MSVLRSRLPAAVATGMVLLLSGCGPEETVAAPSPVAAPAADVVTVVHVTDGDTFDVADGRTVRVLGIDSCEADTDAGKDATGSAIMQLLGRTVTLTAEPGADRDRYDRVLRYVRMSDGQDFGRSMVTSPHTGVYEGGDAGVAYVADLRTLDRDGRACDRPDPAPTSSAAPSPAPDTDSDGDPDRRRVPAPSVPDDDSGSGSGSSSDDDSGGGDGGGTKPRTGNSGHPCLPGERDGDDDGYCGEGR